MPWQDCQVPFQLVVYSLLDRPDGKSQSAVSNFPISSLYFCRFNIDKPFVFQMTNVLSNRVGAHASVLANASDAGSALICLPVLTENQVCVDGQLTGGKSQSENLIGQKKIMAQWAALSVSVLEFRGVTSLMIFQDSIPMFAAMSIAFSDFRFCSQVYSCKHTANPVWRSPILCLLHRKF